MKIPNIKLLKKIDADSSITGVCAGIAYWLKIPVWLVRVLLIIAVFNFNYVLFGYFLLAIFLPEYEMVPDDFEQECE